jgi:hypothetical protein
VTLVPKDRHIVWAGFDVAVWLGDASPWLPGVRLISEIGPTAVQFLAVRFDRCYVLATRRSGGVALPRQSHGVTAWSDCTSSSPWRLT